jgi:hypothetical protein
MQYLIQFYEAQTQFALREDPVQSPAYWGSWMAYIQTITEAGIIVSGAGLQPPHTATTVRVRDGQRQVHDGPYAETKEMLGGFFVVEVPNLDTALDWAARSPAAAYGSTEVRPVLPPSAG